jgi:hypothetical protein
LSRKWRWFSRVSLAVIGFAGVNTIKGRVDNQQRCTDYCGEEKGAGAKSIGMLQGDTQRQITVIETVNPSYWTHRPSSIAGEISVGMRFDNCRQSIPDSVSDDDFNNLLANGAKVVSQSEQTTVSVKTFYTKLNWTAVTPCNIRKYIITE